MCTLHFVALLCLWTGFSGFRPNVPAPDLQNTS